MITWWKYIVTRLMHPVTVDQCPALFYVAYMYVTCSIMGKVQKKKKENMFPNYFLALAFLVYLAEICLSSFKDFAFASSRLNVPILPSHECISC